MDFKFASHGLWSEKQNILLQHMHEKEFWILTNKCGNDLEHESEAEEPWLLALIIFTFSNLLENPVCMNINPVCMCILETQAKAVMTSVIRPNTLYFGTL